MKDVYKKCSVFENDGYLLRLVEVEDAKALLKVYSDVAAVPFFNADNCHGDQFYYKTLDRMKEAINYWLWEYSRMGFVRWAIINKQERQAVGTIELFNRKAKDYFKDCGLLRLDLRSDYENEASIYAILSTILPESFKLFHCNRIATKATEQAVERRRALARLSFVASEQFLVGEDGVHYKDYWVLEDRK